MRRHRIFTGIEGESDERIKRMTDQVPSGRLLLTTMTFAWTTRTRALPPHTLRSCEQRLLSWRPWDTSLFSGKQPSFLPVVGCQTLSSRSRRRITSYGDFYFRSSSDLLTCVDCSHVHPIRSPFQKTTVFHNVPHVIMVPSNQWSQTLDIFSRRPAASDSLCILLDSTRCEKLILTRALYDSPNERASSMWITSSSSHVERARRRRKEPDAHL
ncbi:hypothetical protein BDZ89DRAFT_601378 [Hymenopellis radicata]|nr:hypothetical protein BDZ89DRAFT_601378 [Hymenopellis radicata]